MNPVFNSNRPPVITIGRATWWKRLNSVTESSDLKVVGATQTQCASACPNTTCKCSKATKITGNLDARVGR